MSILHVDFYFPFKGRDWLGLVVELECSIIEKNLRIYLIPIQPIVEIIESKRVIKESNES